MAARKSNREAAARAAGRALHAGDHAPARKWNEPDPSQPRPGRRRKTSPQANGATKPEAPAPAGKTDDRGQSSCDTQDAPAAADDFPGSQSVRDAQSLIAAEDQDSALAKSQSGPSASTPVRDKPGQSAAIVGPPPIQTALLADPLLALSADVLDDLEKVRVANENRLRQLTRSAEDSDGEVRGFGLDLAHPAVARVAAMVKAMKCDSAVVLELAGEKTPRGKNCCLEHDAEKNLAKLLRGHPLGPWVAAQKGVGVKQAARLLAAVGDPYVRPEILREDSTVEPSRPRKVSELWAYCGYHVVQTPVNGYPVRDTHMAAAVDGSSLLAGHGWLDTQATRGGRGQDGGDPGQRDGAARTGSAGVAPKRQRGVHANWSATAKMRAYLVAESCIKQSGTPYRDVYDAARAKYAGAVHAAECVRCGPKGRPAQPGGPLSDGHKHARGLRAVAKEVLRQLWREAKRLHEAPASGQGYLGSQ